MTKESEKFTKMYAKKYLHCQPSKKKIRAQKRKEQHERQNLRAEMEREREMIDIIVTQEIEVMKQLRSNQVGLGNTTEEEDG